MRVLACKHTLLVSLAMWVGADVASHALADLLLTMASVLLAELVDHLAELFVVLLRVGLLVSQVLLGHPVLLTAALLPWLGGLDTFCEVIERV